MTRSGHRGLLTHDGWPAHVSSLWSLGKIFTYLSNIYCRFLNRRRKTPIQNSKPNINDQNSKTPTPPNLILEFVFKTNTSWNFILSVFSLVGHRASRNSVPKNATVDVNTHLKLSARRADSIQSVEQKARCSAPFKSRSVSNSHFHSAVVMKGFQNSSPIPLPTPH